MKDMAGSDSLDPAREKELEENIREHLELLSEKTVNFEDLVAELFGKGCLTVEEKFKVLSGVVEEKSANKTTQGKCGELYATLLRKEIPWSTVLECWRETGNDYLSGRFDTYFILEGRDSSKSQKLSKFKSLPHNRTEFITHLHLIHLQIAPKSLLKSLRKSTKLKSIILENVKIPHGGRAGDDPSAEFDQIVPLPNLKEFHLEELMQDKPFRSIKEVNSFLDELNLKAIMFFTTSMTQVALSKISVSIRLRGANILQMIPTDKEDTECPGLQFLSMLRRRPDQCGGVVNIDSWSKVALYECFVPKNDTFSTLLTHLIIYRCKITNYDPYLRSCTNLSQLHICSEFDYDEFKLAELDISSLNACRMSLKQLSLGFVHLTKSNSTPMIELSLDSLNLNCCQLATESLVEFYELFQQQKSIVWQCGAPHPSPTFLQGALTNTTTDFIAISHFNWDTNDPHCATVKAFLKSTGPPSMVGDEDKFIFKKIIDGNREWSCSDPRDEGEAQFSIFAPSAWTVFSADTKSWFDLPLASSTKQNKDVEYPHTIFCKVKN